MKSAARARERQVKVTACNKRSQEVPSSLQHRAHSCKHAHVLKTGVGTGTVILGAPDRGGVDAPCKGIEIALLLGALKPTPMPPSRACGRTLSPAEFIGAVCCTRTLAAAACKSLFGTGTVGRGAADRGGVIAPCGGVDILCLLALKFLLALKPAPIPLRSMTPGRGKGTLDALGQR